VTSLAIGELGEDAIVVTGDGAIRLWDVTSRVLLRELAAQANSVALGVVDGRLTVITGGQDSLIRLWEAAGGQPIGELRGHVGPVRSVAFGHLDRVPVIVSGGSDNTVRVWDAVSLQALHNPRMTHDGPVMSVAIGQIRGRVMLASGGRDQAIRIWDAEMGEPWHAVDIAATAHSVAICGGRLICAGTKRGIVTLAAGGG